VGLGYGVLGLTVGHTRMERTFGRAGSTCSVTGSLWREIVKVTAWFQIVVGLGISRHGCCWWLRATSRRYPGASVIFAVLLLLMVAHRSPSTVESFSNPGAWTRCAKC
jgi:hypothetical protein